MIRWRLQYSKRTKWLWVETGDAGYFWSNSIHDSWSHSQFNKQDIKFLRFLVEELGDVKTSGHAYSVLQSRLGNIVKLKLGERDGMETGEEKG